MPMNMQPPTVYNTPVKILIPYPHSKDVSHLDVYLYNGTGWVRACDNEGGVRPGGEGWMVPGSRVDHSSGNPSTIEIKVYHFSGVQLGSISSLSFSDSAAEPGGGCFIGAAAFGWEMGRGAHIALLCGLIFLLSNLILTRFLRDS